MAGSEFFKPSGKLRKLRIERIDMGKRMRGFNPLGNRDKDSKLNLVDCRPFNSKKQDIKSFAQNQFQTIKEKTAAFNRRRDERIAKRTANLERRTELTTRQVKARTELALARQRLRIARGESSIGQGLERAGLALGRATVRAAPGFEEFVTGVSPKVVAKPKRKVKKKRRKKKSR